MSFLLMPAFLRLHAGFAALPSCRRRVSAQLWHDGEVPRRNRSLLHSFFLLSCLAVCAVASAQQAPARRTPAQKPPVSSKQAAQASALNSLEQAQNAAVQTGDTAAIASSSRQLARSLLQRLAVLRRAAGDTQQAIAIDAEVRALDASSSPTATDAPPPAASSAALAKQEPLRKLLAQTYNDLGTAEAREGQFAAAETHFQAAARWDTPSPTLLRNLGTAAFRLGDFPTAVRAFAQVLQSCAGTAASDAPAPPPDPHTQLMYALALFSTGDYRAAANAFQPVAGDALRDPRSAYSWAFALARAGDPKQANSIAAQLSTEPLPPPVLSLVCHIFIDTESYGQSAECFRRLSVADPSFPLAHYQVAESLIRLDRPAEAIPELEQELTLSPGDPNVQYSMAFALLQTSRKEEASRLLTTITAAHPEMAQPQYQLGKLLVESGDTTAAIPHLEAAETADPSLDYVHYQLQAAYRRAGRTADADREARLYREIKARHRDQPGAR